MTHRLGSEKSDPVGYGTGNSGTGKTRKTLTVEHRECEIAVPGEREPVSIFECKFATESSGWVEDCRYVSEGSATG